MHNDVVFFLFSVDMCTSAPALTEEEKAGVSFSFPSLHPRLPISSSHLFPSLLLRSDSADGGRPLRVPPSVQTSPSAPPHPPHPLLSPPPSLLHPWLALPRDDVCLPNRQRETRRKRIRRTRSGVLKVSSAAERLCPDTWTRPPQVGCEISVAACFFGRRCKTKVSSLRRSGDERWLERALTHRSSKYSRAQGVSQLLMLWSCMNTLRRGSFSPHVHVEQGEVCQTAEGQIDATS